jgi:hypothetical protein
MINEELIKYIDTQKSRGISREGISKKLSDAGWNMVDINEGLEKVFVVAPVSTLASTPIATPVAEIIKPVITNPIQATPKNEDLIPNLMPKISGPAGALPISQARAVSPMSNSFDSFRPAQSAQATPSVNVMSPGPLPQSAVISSYRKDYQDTGTTNNQIPSSSHWGRFFLILFLFIVLAGGGVIFAGVKGYINLPFEIPFMKPSPGQAMMKMMNNLSNIQTAHYDTNINIFTTTETKFTGVNNPSSGDLTYGFDPEDSKDEFSIDISGQTDVDNTNKQAINYMTNLNIKITPDIFGFTGTNLAFNLMNEDLYIKVPEFDFIKEFVGDTKWVKVQKSDLEDKDLMQTASDVAPVPATFDLAKQKELAKLFAESDLLGSIVEADTEDVGSGQAYHYQTLIEKEKLKSFITKALDIMDDPSIMSSRQELLDSINDFKDIRVDLWITKGTFMLNKIVVEIPFETNETFANMEIKTKANIKFTHTLSKINEPVSITAPSEFKTIKELMSDYESNPTVKDSKIKSSVYNFLPEAELFFDQHANSYGKPNTIGNCASPITGSVFADSNTIKSILDLTGGVGSCYSTAKAYAVSVPLASDKTTRFCVDSQGAMKETKTPLIGTVCK